jgi:Tfp pilus assembly protein PilF
VVLNRQGQVEQAQKCLLKALEHDSENMEAHYNLGLLWESQGVESKALEHYQKFVSKAQGPYTELANELKKRWPALK